MITGADSLQRARAYLVSAQNAIRQGAEDGVSAILDNLLADMVPSTPVRSGRMKADYRTYINGLFGELTDDQAYSGFVARTGTRFMSPNAALLQILTDAEDHASDTIDAMISARLASVR